MLVKQIERVALSRNLPIILCGDFNSEPVSAVYDFMTRNHVPHDHPDLQQLVEVYSAMDLEHQVAFASAYASVFGAEPEYTNYAGTCVVQPEHTCGEYSPPRCRCVYFVCVHRSLVGCRRLRVVHARATHAVYGAQSAPTRGLTSVLEDGAAQLPVHVRPRAAVHRFLLQSTAQWKILAITTDLGTIVFFLGRMANIHLFRKKI